MSDQRLSKRTRQSG